MLSGIRGGIAQQAAIFRPLSNANRPVVFIDLFRFHNPIGIPLARPNGTLSDDRVPFLLQLAIRIPIAPPSGTVSANSIRLFPQLTIGMPLTLETGGKAVNIIVFHFQLAIFMNARRAGDDL